MSLDHQKRRALLSVFNKQGLEPLVRALQKHEYEILSTGGTASAIQGWNIPVTEISVYTGFPELLDGRVKTLHPKIHGGLLYIRNNQEHSRMAMTQGFHPIDIVVVNLYPFAQTIAKAGVTRAEAIENIDIGGPSMLRSAAKNHESVAAVTDPADYAELIRELEENGGVTTLGFRQRLAAKVFRATGIYDTTIANWFDCSSEQGVQQERSNVLDAGPV